MKKILLILTALAFVFGNTHAQNPGDLDTSFGINGYTITDPYANTGETYSDMIRLSDNKIVKVGFTDDGGDADILVAKFLSNGTPDNSFGVDGFQKIDLSIGNSEQARGVAELPNGKLLVTGIVLGNGTADAFIMRLNADGTIDPSFGTASGHTKFNTGDNTGAWGQVVVTSGSEIYVAGSVKVNGQFDIMLTNFTMGGGIDASFASSGFATLDLDGGTDQILSMDRKANGAFVFGGVGEFDQDTKGFITSLSQFGTPVNFGTNGVYVLDGENKIEHIYDLFVDDNDNIIFSGGIGGGDDVDGFVRRLTPNGQLDTDFANGGEMKSDPGMTTALTLTSVSEMPNGHIIAVGHFEGASQDIYAMLLTNEGKLVTDFGGNGDVIIPLPFKTTEVNVTSSVIQYDGSIIIGGFLESEDFVGENMFMVRLLPNQENTSIFELKKELVKVYPNPATDAFSIQMEHIEEVQLMSIQGQRLATWGAQNRYDIPSGIPAGVYILQIKSKNGVGASRLVID